MSKIDYEQDAMDNLRAEFEEKLDRQDWAAARERIMRVAEFSVHEANILNKELEAAMFEDMELHTSEPIGVDQLLEHLGKQTGIL